MLLSEGIAFVIYIVNAHYSETYIKNIVDFWFNNDE
jgi:hypothetical protein